jgi:CRISPR/Cas system CSM-associated protein Csm3 (group 7 of RAMP superfamily)
MPNKRNILAQRRFENRFRILTTDNMLMEWDITSGRLVSDIELGFNDYRGYEQVEIRDMRTNLNLYGLSDYSIIKNEKNQTKIIQIDENLVN